MNLFLVKLSTDATYQEGIYSIVRGYYGPTNSIGVENFRAIFGGNVINIGSMERVLMLLGVVPPEGDLNVDYLRERVLDLGKVLPFVPVAASPTFSVRAEDLPPVAEVEVPAAFVCDYEQAIEEMRRDGFDYKMAFQLKSLRPPHAMLRRVYYLYKVALGEEVLA